MSNEPTSTNRYSDLTADELLLRISAIDATDAEKMEFLALKNILNKWSEKIANYYSELNKIKEATNVKPNS